MASLEPVLAEITRSIQLQFLDTAEIGIGGRQLRDPNTACGGHNQRVVHQKTVPSPNVRRTKESSKLERHDIDPHQRNTFDLLLVDMQLADEVRSGAELLDDFLPRDQPRRHSLDHHQAMRDFGHNDD